jgi:hypothetical protein
LFPTITGQRLSRDAIEHRLAHYVAKASQSCDDRRLGSVRNPGAAAGPG